MPRYDFQPITSSPITSAVQSMFETDDSDRTRYGRMVDELITKLDSLNTSSNKPSSVRFPLDVPQLKWEGHVQSGPYRLDFDGFTGDKYARMQMQVGTGRTKKSGTVAEILVQCGREFGVGQVVEALRLSLTKKMICRMTMD
jgi:hypothetical protein